jgi:hypothetical protein
MCKSCGGFACATWRCKLVCEGRLAQLVRAPCSHRGGHRFEPCAAHSSRRSEILCRCGSYRCAASSTFPRSHGPLSFPTQSAWSALLNVGLSAPWPSRALRCIWRLAYQGAQILPTLRHPLSRRTPVRRFARNLPKSGLSSLNPLANLGRLSKLCDRGGYAHHVFLLGDGKCAKS